MNPEQIAYDTAYVPPAPVVRVFLVNPFNPSLQMQLMGLIDTGADITVVPEEVVAQLGLIRHGDILVLVRDFNRVPSFRPTYIVDVQIGQRWFDLVEVISAPTNELLLGRNVINSLDLRLNGPQLVLEILNA
ncbi:MAG: retropepsin-like aspartic protease [Armatimonadota bacterium]